MMTSSISEKLSETINSISFQFSESKLESRLKINNYPPVFFDNHLENKRVCTTANWIRRCHESGSLHEPATIAALLFVQQNFAPKINTIFDIGALYGYFSLISKSVFPESMVFSFEMNPHSYLNLSKNVSLNKHLSVPAVRCVNAGVSDKTTLQKKVYVKNFILKEDIDSENSQIIDLLSLDDFCRLSRFQPDLIKIDVEGYQAKIIPGAMSMIKSAKPIIILEFDAQETIQNFNTTNKEVVKPLFDLGYTCYWCKDQRSFAGKFKQLGYEDFSPEHEINSVSIFLPN